MATFNIVLDKRRKKDGNSYPLCVRVSHHKDVLYLSLKINLTEKEFEKTFQKKSFTPESQKIRDRYDKYLERARAVFDRVQPFNSTQFRKVFFNTRIKLSNGKIPEKGADNLHIENLFTNYLNSGLQTKRISIGTSDNYKYGLSVLLKFRPGLAVDEITPEFLSELEIWFLEKGNSMATLGSILRGLRTILNYFIKEEVIPDTYKYPFKKYKIPEYRPPKMVISNSEIQSIIDLKEFGNISEEYARNIWVLLYRLNGINFIDLLQFRWDDIRGNHLVFRRHKTKRTRRNNVRSIKIRITDKIQELLDRVGDKSSIFILGLLRDGYDEVYLKNKNKKIKKKINLELHKISKRLNLSVPLDISLARDAYANTLKRANIPIAKIGEMLDHANPTTTLNYLDMYDQETLDEVNDHIL
jgi:integrase/recombinase XerD